MGRYYYGEGKDSTEDYSKQLKINDLKKYGYLKEGLHIQSGVFSWLRNGEAYSKISLEVNKQETEGYLRVTFYQTDRETDEKKEFDYKIKLVSTSCNYGGVRWWFICPCGGNRCGILYMQNNGYFASRKTLNLCYSEQKESKRSRYMSYLMGKPFNDMYLLKDKIKYPYRNGKPTRKMRRFLKLHNQMPSMEEVENISSLLWKK